jgi:hypothetical protein
MKYMLLILAGLLRKPLRPVLIGALLGTTVAVAGSTIA